jgi:tyrosinase
MTVEIVLDATAEDGRAFLGWAPVKASARLKNPSPGNAPVPVTLSNGGTATGGRVVFDTKRSDAGRDQLPIVLPASGQPVEFWVAGQFQRPSIAYADAAIDAIGPDGAALGRRELMVRIRKNAVKLTADERDRFLIALGKLNDQGNGPFRSFRDTHVEDSYYEAHGYPGFPPWHRAYLLDLERSLQAIDATVTLPYWRFDEPASALFAPEFLGMPPANPSEGDVIDFPYGHPLETWRTDTTSDPIARRPRYNIANAPPSNNVITQKATLELGDNFPAFRSYEGRPHGYAHTSFQGPVNNPSTAAKDPLFFLLHANVDRLWAFWQWYYHRTDPDDPKSYALTGPPRQPNNIGHKLDDTLWPWNGDTVAPRPNFKPPRGAFPVSSLVTRPGATPTIRDMIDYQGVKGGPSLGFDYDDVPFELHSTGPVS